ncbi:MAG: hypothetical protein ABR506_01480 [Candidatus Krumholzibacteriia bacterium]
MKSTLRAALLAGLLLAAGCASAPRESIELSATVGRDLVTVHAANRALADVHFRYLLADVDAFVDEVYRPYVIERSAIDLDLVGEFEAALAGTHDLELDALDVLVIYSEEVTARIGTFRTELRAPLEARRDSVLAAIDHAFRQLQTANAVVTGHLASIVKVHDAQADLLRDADLADYRRTVAHGLADLADDLARILAEARAIDRGIDALADRVESARARGENLDDLPAKLRALTRRPPGDPGDGGMEP